MKRFFVDRIGDAPVLRGEEHKHLSVVLRAKVGDEVVLCAGNGLDAVCKIAEITREETRLKIESIQPNVNESRLDVTLYFAVLKGDKNDFVVQKAVELGVRTICPMRTKFVQNRSPLKIDRLQRIATEAAKQCGRGIIPAVTPEVKFEDAARGTDAYDLVLFPYEKSVSGYSLKSFLREKLGERSVRSVAVFVGSEGGFADEEADLLAVHGVTSVTLGSRILRAETANVAVLSDLMYEAEL